MAARRTETVKEEPGGSTNEQERDKKQTHRETEREGEKGDGL